MTTPNDVLRRSGYNIPRSPTMHFAPPSPPRSATPPLDEDIPAPYAYTMMMVSTEDDKQAIRERFMHECNLKRWHHIHNAQVKVKVPK